jgi:hypothetical protein
MERLPTVTIDLAPLRLLTSALIKAVLELLKGKGISKRIDELGE